MNKELYPMRIVFIGAFIIYGLYVYLAANTPTHNSNNSTCTCDNKVQQ